MDDKTERSQERRSNPLWKPFSPFHVPTVTTTVQNILISTGTLFSALFSLWATFTLLLPLAFLRAIMPPVIWRLLARSQTHRAMSQKEEVMQQKRVLVVDALSGLGLGIVKELLNVPGAHVTPTTGKNLDQLRGEMASYTTAASDFGVERLSFTDSRKEIVDAIKKLDDEKMFNEFFFVGSASQKLDAPFTPARRMSGSTIHVAAQSPQMEGQVQKETQDPSQNQGQGLKSLENTEKSISSTLSGMITVILTMYNCMKARGYGTITIAIPENNHEDWSWLSTILASHPPHATFRQITEASVTAFLRTFALSLRFMAGPTGVDVVTVMYNPHPDTRLIKPEYTYESGNEVYFTRLARSVIRRAKLDESSAGYYHDHEYLATASKPTMLEGVVSQVVRGFKFNPIIDGILARSIDWSSTINPKAMRRRMTSSVRAIVGDFRKKVGSRNLKEYGNRKIEHVQNIFQN